MEKQTGIKIINYINLFSAIFLITQLPIYYAKPQHVALILFFTSYLIEFILEKKWLNFKWDKTQWIFVLFILYFLLTIIYAPFEKETKYLPRISEIRLPFLALGLIGLFGVNKLYRLRYFAYTFIITSLLMISYLVFYKVGFFVMIEDPNRELLFAEARKLSINSHMIFNYFLNISLVFVFYLLLSKNNIRDSLIIKIIAAFSGLIIYSILLLTEGRLGFLMANLIVFGMLFYLFWKWNKKLSILVGVSLLIGFGYVISRHNRINYDKISHEPRLVIWKLATEVIEENLFWGNGASTGATIFMEKLANCKNLNIGPDDPILEAINSKRLLGAHAHSQFFMTAIEFGIIGLIIFILLNAYPLFVMPPNLKIFILLFVVVSTAQLLTDIYFSGLTPLTYALLMVLFFRSVETRESEVQP